MIEHVALRVTDLDRSIAFYRDILGLEAVGRRKIAGGTIDQVVFRVGEDVLVLFHAGDFVPEDPDVKGGVDHVAFCLPEADYRAVVERLRAAGHTIHRGEEKNLGAFGVGYATYFYDPDRIEIEIKRYDDPPEQPGPEWYESAKALEPRGR